MNRIRLGDVLYRKLKHRENELENEIKKLKRLERELEELKNLLYSSQNYREENSENYINICFK